MRRREFLAGFGSAICWPRFVSAQQRIVRIGILLLGERVDVHDLTIVSELAKIGYVSGRNVLYEIRSAEGDLSKAPALARELVTQKPDVLISATAAAAEILAAETSEIPIVLTVTVDPVAIGISTSMSRPSRNITGFTSAPLTIASKRLELLRELIPTLSRVAYLGGPRETHYGTPEQQEVLTAAGRLGITVFSVPITTTDSVPEAFATVDRENADAIVVGINPTNLQVIGHINNECLVRDLPAIYPWPFPVRSGGLMSYGPASLENHTGTARYVDRLLKGAKISDLPFQDPTEFKLVINMRTARAMKIQIPQSLLARADEVIE